ncbi:hypothetical protein TM239_01690 [Bradyrhizobium sp. TM239]|nr:hypothetical protein TM239_01690 [Bradyrhizobium sp. TM239]
MAFHLTRWGGFDAESDGRWLTKVRSENEDPGENGLIADVASAQHHPARIAVHTYARGGWSNGRGLPRSGGMTDLSLCREKALELASAELRRVCETSAPTTSTEDHTAGKPKCHLKSPSLQGEGPRLAFFVQMHNTLPNSSIGGHALVE